MMHCGMGRAEGAALVAPVALLHVFAFGLGYVLSRVLGFNEKTARTVSIETGTGPSVNSTACSLSCSKLAEWIAAGPHLCQRRVAEGHV